MLIGCAEKKSTIIFTFWQNDRQELFDAYRLQVGEEFICTVSQTRNELIDKHVSP